MKEVRINLDEHDEKTRLYNIENNTNKLLVELGGVKDNTNKLLDEFGGMKDTLDTILLITLSKDTNCPYNQRIKLNNILKKKRENIILKYTNTNPNNTSNNQINVNIPINTTLNRKIKINSPLKNDNPAFIKKYDDRKYRASININKTKNAPKINLKKKKSIADYSNSLSIKSKNYSMGAFGGRCCFGYLNTKDRRNNNSLNPFRTDIYKKEDKKQQKNYAKA